MPRLIGLRITRTGEIAPHTPQVRRQKDC